MQGICAVDDCDRERYAKSYCNLHWRRWRKHGDPLVGARRRPRSCSIEGCERRAEVGDWCNAHYKRWKRNGTPTPQLPRLEERFFARVIEGADGCWLWKYPNKLGYGLFNPAHEQRGAAHRWAYEFLRAEIPQGLVLDHLCSNPQCVNPWHLEPVTQRINVLRGYERARAQKSAAPT